MTKRHEPQGFLSPAESLRRRPDRGMLFVVLAVAALLFAYLFWSGYQTARREAQITVNNLAGMLATNVEASLDRATSDIRVFVPQATDDDLGGRMDAERQADLEARMGYHLRAFPAALNYHIINASGRSVAGAGSANGHLPISVEDRAWFQELRNDATRELVISDVLVGKATGSQTVILGVPIRSPTGAFRGAVNAALNLGYFQRLIDGLDIGSQGLVVVRRTEDSRLVVRRPQLLEQLNAAPKDGALTSLITSGVPAAQGDFVSALDGVNRVYAFRRLSGYPISVIVAVSASDYLFGWRIQTALAGAAAVVLIAAVVLLFRRQDRIGEALAASDARFRHVLRTASDGVHILAADGALVAASDSFYAMLGYEHPVAMHVSDWDAQWSEDGLRSQVLPDLLDSPRTFCTRHRRCDGTEFDVEIHSQAIELDGKRLVYAAARDITERLAAETRLAEALVRIESQAADLARSNADLQQFAYAASHDMREPLRMISAYLSLLERRLGGQLDQDCREFFAFARDGAQRLDRMILGLLDYSRIGRDSSAPEPVSLGEALDEATANLSLAIEAAQASIDVPQPLPRVLVNRTDAVRLLQNLLGNAVKYRSPERPPELRLTARRVGSMWEVAVADNGIGISADDCGRIFGIFQRLHGAEIEGCGIGLASCRKITRQHGGDIRVESEPGKGSTFIFTLPAAG